MALNRFQVGVVSRSAGQSSIARAAYNAREKLIDHRTALIKDYRHLGEPEWKGIFAPEQAPPWATDREALWNAVERREDESTRPDSAQPARDFKIALPHELSRDQRRQLTEEFARYMAQRGMIVDVAIHAPDRGDDPRNYHFHMLASMRSVTPEGFGNKVREWNRDTELLEWKEHWSELGARHLEQAGFEREAERFRVGHLTNQKQREAALERGDYDWAEALDRTPKKHMGPQAHAMEKDGIETLKGDLNREIEERNTRRADGRALNRAEGEIRLAYQLTDRAQAFADALEDRGLILARVSEGDVDKLAALEARRFREKEAEHQGKLGYLGRRIAEEEEGRNLEKSNELRQRREKLKSDYEGGLPWVMRQGGAQELSPDQRETAQRRYDEWKHKDKHSFENYVSYVQNQWRDHPEHRTRFRPNDLVVVNHDGDVYPITQRNTGEDPKLLRKYLREIETSPLFSVCAAWAVFKAVNDHRGEESRWQESEKTWPIHAPELRPEERKWSVLAHLYKVDRSWDSANSDLTRDTRPRDVPEELAKPRSVVFPEQPAAAHIWEAFNRNRHSPNGFAKALDREDILLCAVTKTEADHSHRTAAFAREINRYSPRFREGEIVAIGPDARIHKLNERATGASPEDLERFFRKTDRAQLPSVREGTEIMQGRAEARQAGAQLMRKLYPLQPRPAFERSLAAELKGITRKVRHAASVGIDGAERVGRFVGKILDFGAEAFESLLSPVLTPEQKRLGELATETRKFDAETAERKRREFERER
jgi:hypothetical protein